MNSIKDLFDNFLADLYIHPIFKHNWLTNLNKLSDQSFLMTFRDYICSAKIYGKNFPSYVENAIAVSTSQRLIAALRENLYEELGSGDHLPHAQLYQMMADELDVGSYKSPLGPNPLASVTERLIREKLGGHEKFVTLGALIIGSEWAVPRLYSPILERIKACTTVDLPSSTHFFELHVQCDAEHAELGILGLLDEVKSDSHFMQVRFGAISALNLRLAAFDALEFRLNCKLQEPMPLGQTSDMDQVRYG